jgi:hypothetical protein
MISKAYAGVIIRTLGHHKDVEREPVRFRKSLKDLGFPRCTVLRNLLQPIASQVSATVGPSQARAVRDRWAESRLLVLSDI